MIPHATADARLDRLPICRFHRHVPALVGSGLFGRRRMYQVSLQGSVQVSREEVGDGGCRARGVRPAGLPITADVFERSSAV